MTRKKDNSVYEKILRRGILPAVIAVVAVFNAVWFFQYQTAHLPDITDYQHPVDEFAAIREPRLWGYYSQAGKKNLPVKMIVLPENENYMPSQSLKKIFERLSTPAENIRLVAAKEKTLEKGLQKMATYLPPNATTLADNRLIYNEMNAAEIVAELSVTDEDMLTIWFEDLNKTDMSAGVRAMSLVAEKARLVPHIFDLAVFEDSVAEKADDSARADYKTPECQAKNLRAFVHDYHEELQSVLSVCWQDGRDCGKKFAKVGPLFDKGAVIVLGYDEKNGKYHEAGSLNVDQPLVDAIGDAVSEVRKELPTAMLKVYLVTSTRLLKVQNEAELAGLLAPDDGVLLVSGLRQAVMLPYFHNIYSNQKEFFKQLKVKSGLSPDFWPNDAKIYSFKVVEITKDVD